jgi:hypothetical protein
MRSKKAFLSGLRIHAEELWTDFNTIPVDGMGNWPDVRQLKLTSFLATLA